jgi:hypothetical protein
MLKLRYSNMGSEVVTARIEQKGAIDTDPTDESPSSSRPIEQRANTDSHTFENPIEQRLTISTASSGATQFSTPIEQKKGDDFATSSVSPDDSIIEQLRVESGGLSRDPDYDGLLEQFEKISTAERLEQRSVRRDTAANGTPIEQRAAPSNTTQVDQEDLLQLIFPPCNSIKIPVTTDIRWRIADLGFTFDTSTLIFKIGGLEVQDSSNFTLTILGNGIEFIYDPPENFPYSTLIQTYFQISDTADPPNTIAVNCSFFTAPDTVAPAIYNFVPTCYSEDVDVKASISFDVVDAGDGVDPDSIVLSVEGLPVCSGITLSPVTIPGSGTGYHVVWEHEEDPFRFDSNVSAAIVAEDLSDSRNSVLFVCSFNTEISQVPVFQNFDPEPCETFVDTETGLYFEVYGVEHGVDISTLEVRVDNALRRVYVRPRILRKE